MRVTKLEDSHESGDILNLKFDSINNATRDHFIAYWVNEIKYVEENILNLI